MERTDWSLAKHPACLAEEELSFGRDEAVVEMDLRGDRLVYLQSNQAQSVLKGMNAPPYEDLENTLVQWLERECQSSNIPQPELRAGSPVLASLVSVIGRNGRFCCGLREVA